MAEIYLHTWIPEIGPLPQPVSPEETALSTAARLALHGNLPGAFDQFQKIHDDTKDVRIKLLASFSKMHVMWRNFSFVGGGIIRDPELRLARMSAMSPIKKEMADDSAKAHDTGALQIPDFSSFFVASHVLNYCVFDNDSFGFGGAFQISNPQLRAAAANAAANVARDCQTRASQLHTILAADSQAALDDLVAAQSAWTCSHDAVSARLLLKRGSDRAKSLGWDEARSAWLVREGDLYAAPEGRVYSLGLRLDADFNIRSGLDSLSHSLGVNQADIWPHVESSSIKTAQDLYKEAYKLLPPKEAILSEGDFAIRDAYLSYLLREQVAPQKFVNAARIAERSATPSVQIMSAACAGLVGGDRVWLQNAVKQASLMHLLGVTYSINELSDAWASRKKISGDLFSARNILIAVSEVDQGSNINTERARLLIEVASAEDSLGRTESGINFLDSAAELQRKWFVEVDEANAKFGIHHDDDTGLELNARDAALSLATTLFSLSSSISKLEAQEGLAAWSSRKERVKAQALDLEKRFRLSETLSPFRLILSDRDFNSPFAEAIHKMRKPETCPGLIREALKSKDGLQLHTLQHSLILFGAERCDKRLRDEVYSDLIGIDAASKLKAAVQAWRSTPSSEAAIEMQFQRGQAMSSMNIAAEEGFSDLVARWYDQLTAILTGTAAAEQLRPELDLYRARAATVSGHPEVARSILHQILGESEFRSPNLDRDFAEKVFDASISAEALAGDAKAALLARVQDEAERARLLQLSRGMEFSKAETAEFAMRARSHALTGDGPDSTGLTYPAVDARPVSITENDVKEALHRLPANTVALIFHPLRNRILIWRYDSSNGLKLASSPHTGISVVLSGRRLLNRLANNQADWIEESQQLYQALISPVGPIPSGTTLALFGVDRLGGFPFETLGPNVHDTLLASHAILYVNSLIDTRSQSARPVRRESLQPLFVGINTPRLERPETEAAELAGLWKSQALLLGNQATVERVRSAARSAGIIHLSAHGVLDESNPYRSHIVLADGPLEAWQLFQDTSRTDLVVLSACDTKRAPSTSSSVTGQQASSLTAIAFDGGVRRIISSLWAAEDQSAMEIMSAFYRNLLDHPHDVAGALRIAKLSAMQRCESQPGRYSNFVLAVRSPADLML